MKLYPRVIENDLHTRDFVFKYPKCFESHLDPKDFMCKLYPREFICKILF